MGQAFGRAMCLSNRAIFMLFLFSFVRLPLSEPGSRRSLLKNAASVPIPLIVPVLGFGYRLLFLPRCSVLRRHPPWAETQARLEENCMAVSPGCAMLLLPQHSNPNENLLGVYILGRDHAGSPGSEGASPGSLRQLKFLKSSMQGTPADPQFLRRLGAVATAFVQGSHDQADFVVVDVNEILASQFAERKTA